MTFPKIELHVRLEGTIRAGTLLQVGGRKDVPLPAAAEADPLQLYGFTDFAHLPRVWQLTTGALRRDRDFRQVVVDYAGEAASHGAAAAQLGVGSQQRYAAGGRGALCDERRQVSLQRIGAEFDWTATALTREPA